MTGAAGEARGWTLQGRADTVEAVAKLLLTVSMCNPPDQPVRLNFTPEQCRHLGRTLQAANDLQARHDAIRDQMAKAEATLVLREAACSRALADAQKHLRCSIQILAGSALFLGAGLVVWWLA